MAAATGGRRAVAGPGAGGPAAHAQTWMVSTTPYIKLGVLDKYNALGGYTAAFIVTNEKTGQECLLIKQVPKGRAGWTSCFRPSPATPITSKTCRA
ncbi:MAG: hypothetical protein WKG07_04915 [Hymenobacter sp.]